MTKNSAHTEKDIIDNFVFSSSADPSFASSDSDSDSDDEESEESSNVEGVEEEQNSIVVLPRYTDFSGREIIGIGVSGWLLVRGDNGDAEFGTVCVRRDSYNHPIIAFDNLFRLGVIAFCCSKNNSGQVMLDWCYPVYANTPITLAPPAYHMRANTEDDTLDFNSALTLLGLHGVLQAFQPFVEKYGDSINNISSFADLLTSLNHDQELQDFLTNALEANPVLQQLLQHFNLELRRNNINFNQEVIVVDDEDEEYDPTIPTTTTATTGHYVHNNYARDEESEGADDNGNDCDMDDAEDDDDEEEIAMVRHTQHSTNATVDTHNQDNDIVVDLSGAGTFTESTH